MPDVYSDDPDVTAKKSKDGKLVNLWANRIEEARDREKDWRKDAKEAVVIFEADKDKTTPYNILYANTQILSPSVYNNPPRPRVKRRYNDDDPTGKAGAEVVQRVLEYLIDDSDPNYASIDGISKKGVLQALVAGRGQAKVKYDPVFSKDGDKLAYETICAEHVPYDRFYHGYGKEWCDIPWIAFEHYKTKDELKEILRANDQEESIADAVEYDYSSEAMKAEQDSKIVTDVDTVELAQIYEIWDKVNKKVIFIASGYEDKPLFVLDDPLQLSGFYNVPEPIGFFHRISGLTPQILYKIYRNQANELNAITRRISKIIDALKVRGFYDGNLGTIGELLTQEDNTLLPAENIAALEGKALDNFIWFFPIEKLVGVLQQLYVAREQVKGVIFELTGIADIMRGDSTASETLGAQNLKSQWGSMRLKEMQKEVARFIRDLLRLMAELAITKLDQKTIMAMTELDYPTNQEKEELKVQLQQLQLQVAQMQQSGIPPEQVQQQLQPLQAQMEPMQARLAQPSWEDILVLLKDDLMRQYRIDIETNSTIEIEASEDKQEVAEFLNAFAQFLNGISPLVQSGQMPFPVAKAIMAQVIRKYRFGEEVEDQIMKMQEPPAPTDPNKEANDAKMAMDKQKAELDMQAKQQDMQIKQQSAELDMQLKQAKAQQDEQEAVRQQQQSEQEHNLKLLELSQRGDLQNKKFEIDMNNLAMKNAVSVKKAQDQLNQSKGE